jgi:hypothetical protein
MAALADELAWLVCPFHVSISGENGGWNQQMRLAEARKQEPLGRLTLTADLGRCISEKAALSQTTRAGRYAGPVNACPDVLFHNVSFLF